MKLKIINAQDKELTVDVPSDQELEQFEMRHDHAGNGLIMVENIDEEFCRMVSAGRGTFDPQAFLAWKPKLRVGLQEDRLTPQPIRDDVKPAILELREDIKAGRKRIVNTWIRNESRTHPRTDRRETEPACVPQTEA